MDVRINLMKIIILAGGTGTRLWPYSREKNPKQILPILGNETLLQQTYQRLCSGFRKEDILVVTGERWQKHIRRELPGLPRANLLSEPMRRDSGGAIGLAAAYLLRKHKDEVLISVHADHWIADSRAYIAVLKRAGQLAEQEREHTIVVGVKPAYPEIGYGYIQVNKKIAQGVWRAERFIEKPALPAARRFLKSGNYFWNVGWFAWKLSHLWNLYKKHLPENFAVLERLSAASDWPGAVKVEFPKLRSISIDKGIAEKETRMLLLSTTVGWADIGHWRSVHEMSDKDAEGNVVSGQSLLLDSRDNLFVAPRKKLIAALGVRDLLVVDTKDALLLVDRRRAQDVKKLVEQLKEKSSWQKYL